MPLALQRLLRDSVLSTPVLVVAGVTAMAFLYGETTLSKEPHKIAAQALMREAVQYAPLLQSGPKPGRGELSFYAERVVRPVDAQEISELLEQHAELWLVGEDPPELTSAAVESIRQIDELKLFRITRRP